MYELEHTYTHVRIKSELYLELCMYELEVFFEYSLHDYNKGTISFVF